MSWSEGKALECEKIGKARTLEETSQTVGSSSIHLGSLRARVSIWMAHGETESLRVWEEQGQDGDV